MRAFLGQAQIHLTVCVGDENLKLVRRLHPERALPVCHAEKPLICPEYADEAPIHELRSGQVAGPRERCPGS